MNYNEIKFFSGKLRKNQTEAEKQLWIHIRNRQLDGFKFLRQHPVIYDRKGNDLNAFIPDFYCPKVRLAIEVDGGVHVIMRDYDRWREEILTGMGITVLRFHNDELSEIEGILKKIRAKLKLLHTDTRPPTPPCVGRGRGG
jgi:very-short-patch-repair endonuclease